MFLSEKIMIECAISVMKTKTDFALKLFQKFDSVESGINFLIMRCLKFNLEFFTKIKVLAKDPLFVTGFKLSLTTRAQS